MTLLRQIDQVDGRFRWYMGDVASEVAKPANYGEYRLGGFARDAGIDYATLRDYKRVAESYPADSVDRSTHPWTVFRVLADQDDRLHLLAQNPGWGVNAARKLVRDRKAKQVGPPDLYHVAGVTADAEQVEHSIDVLSATHGTDIKRTLQAGHSPFAKCDYWAAVKQHRALVPGHGDEPAKIAFIHQIEAVLGISDRVAALTWDCRSFVRHVAEHIGKTDNVPADGQRADLEDAYEAAGAAYQALGEFVAAMQADQAPGQV